MRVPGQKLMLTIDHLSRQGEGVAHVEGLPVFVPFALPDEQVIAQMTQVHSHHAHAQVVEVTHVSPQRQSPPCPHFSRCGGCQLQHLPVDMYRHLKREMLCAAVTRAGYDASTVGPLVEIGPASRRRVELAVQIYKGEVRLGFYEARSHEVIPLTMCPVMEPALFALVTQLLQTLQTLKKPSVIRSIALTLADNGVDAEINLHAALKDTDKARLTALATVNQLIRLTLLFPDRERLILFDHSRPVIHLGAATIELSPGAFLQASRVGQAVLTEAVLTHLAEAPRVVDLYAGCGTYSLPLATRGHRVTSYEGDPEMVNTLQNAIRLQRWDDRASAHIRDLFRQPLASHELQSFDAAIINPPRNGALPQITYLAQSHLSQIVMVSCNPATFARDAAALRPAGYQLVHAMPVDQFHWSTHLELVAFFRHYKNT